MKKEELNVEKLHISYPYNSLNLGCIYGPNNCGSLE